MIKQYKNFDIEIKKNIYGFYYSKITIYKNKGYREEEYYLTTISHYTNNIKEVIKEVKDTIKYLIEDGISFESNGKLKAYYLPSIND